ncbi:chymotrypsin-like protease CTRL-1 [Lepeophtheirus salmonis]|uniref:Silk gland derived serine protease [Bombyx mori] n=1 Tax=Lepeophtheirus salmonis TaxID=72036 RepID=A0A0K2T4Z9_LEPSM|nr:transmembrane protease serine 6-like [Lepeophtheirus salmonis]
MTDSRLSTEYYNKNTKIVSVVSISITGLFIAGMGIMLFDSIINKVDVNAVVVGNCTCGKRRSNPDEKELNSKLASWNEFPWHVGILQTLTQRIICGGALLSNRYVITTGTCLEIIRNQSISEREYLLKVVLGEHNVEDNKIEESQWFWIMDFYFYPEFNHTTRDYDFAIIKLSSKATFSNYVYPVCLPSSSNSYYVGSYGFVAGFATINAREGNKEIVHLQKEKVRISNGCPLLKNYDWSDRNICVKDSRCRGDQGSALVLQEENQDWYFIAGLASFWTKRDCSIMGFSRIDSDILDWIRSTMIGTTICTNSTYHEQWLASQPVEED